MELFGICAPQNPDSRRGRGASDGSRHDDRTDAGCHSLVAGCQSVRSRDSSSTGNNDSNLNEFIQEIEQMKLFGPARAASKLGSEALAKCRQERAARAAWSGALCSDSISYQDLPIQISDKRKLSEIWNSSKKMLVIMTGCSSEVKHSVGPMACLVANHSFEEHMYMPSVKLLHKPISKLFGPATHEAAKLNLMSAMRESREMPSTYMLVYGGPAAHHRVVVSTTISSFYLRDSWNRPNAFAVLQMDYLGKAKVETIEYWRLRNEFADVTDAALTTTKKQLQVRVDKNFNIASRCIEKTIRRGEEYDKACKKDDPYTSEAGQISKRMRGVSDGSLVNFNAHTRSSFRHALSRTAEAGLDEYGVLRGATLETFGNRSDTVSEDAYAREQFRKASDARQNLEFVERQLSQEDRSYFAHPKFGLKAAAQ